MGITCRSNGKWQVSLQTYGMTIYSATFPTEDEAREWQADAKRALRHKDMFLTREGDWMVAIVARPAPVEGKRKPRELHRRRFKDRRRATIWAREVRSQITVHRPPPSPTTDAAMEHCKTFHDYWLTPKVWACAA